MTKEWIQNAKAILKGEKSVSIRFHGGYIAMKDEMEFERDKKMQHIDPTVRVYGADIPKNGAVLTKDGVLTIIKLYSENSQFKAFVDNLPE